MALSSNQIRLDLMNLKPTAFNEKYEIVPETVRDTIFVEAGAEFPQNTTLFGNSEKNKIYRTTNFPNNSQAFALKSLRVEFMGQFSTTNTTDDERARALSLAFHQFSFIDFRLEGNESFNEPIAHYAPYIFAHNPDINTNTNPNVTIEASDVFRYGKKFNAPIIIGAGKTFNCELNVPSGFTTMADTATNRFTFPGSGLGNSQTGHALMIEFFADKIKERS